MWKVELQTQHHLVQKRRYQCLIEGRGWQTANVDLFLSRIQDGHEKSPEVALGVSLFAMRSHFFLGHNWAEVRLFDYQVSQRTSVFVYFLT